MSNEKTRIKLTRNAVCLVLRKFSINHKETRMPNDKGWRLDLTSKDFKSLLINVYDTDTVTVQGGGPAQTVLVEHLRHALALYQFVGLRRKREEDF
ncbi:hypothetical protein LJB81_00925 [Desulfovibrio sp. OttesenSCG-928-M14]|nr:hypothetical protein [Desulfovibrio sp. OttesenSCG-928-M14]